MSVGLYDSFLLYPDCRKLFSQCVVDTLNIVSVEDRFNKRVSIEAGIHHLRNIIYDAQIMSNQPNDKQNVFMGNAETDFKHRFNNHTKSFNLEHYENDTELSKEY